MGSTPLSDRMASAVYLNDAGEEVEDGKVPGTPRARSSHVPHIRHGAYAPATDRLVEKLGFFEHKVHPRAVERGRDKKLVKVASGQ